MTESVAAGLAGYAGNGTSLALDAAGRPSIAYVAGADLMLARWNGTAWTTEVVDPALYSSYPSLALDGAGNPVIAYRAYQNGVKLALGRRVLARGERDRWPRQR